MFFSRKKKLIKDREAGLTFNWRGSRGYQWGKVMAFVISGGLFIFAVYALKIGGEQKSMSEKREAVVMVIDQLDPSNQALMMIVEQRSPFPPRWDPAYDVGVLKRVNEGLESMMGASSSYDTPLLPIPEESYADYSVSNVRADDGLFYQEILQREVPEALAASGSRGGLLRNISILESSALSSRLECLYHPLPDGLVSESSYGQSYEFIVGLDTKGEVFSCLPVTGGAMDTIKPSNSQRKLASWLRKQNYKAADDITVGMIELQIEAVREIIE